MNKVNYLNSDDNDESIDVLFAYDCSGSTNSCTNYHKKNQLILNSVLSTIEVMKANGKKVNFKIIKWDDSCQEISVDELNRINRDKLGYMGTSPEKVCDYIKLHNFKGNLMLISDGQISQSSVNYCSDSLMEWSFKNVYVCLIGSSYSVNESISCAFTRNCSHNIEINRDLNSESEVISVTDDDYKLLKTMDIENIHDISDFLILAEKIKNVLISTTMGTKGNKILYEKFIKLKNKLIKSQSIIKDNLLINDLTADFEGGLRLDPKKLHKIWDEYYFKNDNEWSKQIDMFISWCNGGLSSVFDRKHINGRIERAEVCETVSPETVTLMEEKETNISISHQCPITLECSPNIIILMRKNGNSVFDSLSTNHINAIINCPLNALDNIYIVKYLKTLFDSCISIEAYKELCEHGISDSSPLTREEIFGGLCLGSHKSHVSATNSTIRNIMTLGKSLGNVDLWYAVLYFMIEKGHVTHLNEYLPNLREHMIFRLRHSKSYMCLSGLPTFPTYKVNLGLCLWTVITASSCGSEFAKNPKNDPLRFHLSYTDEIIELLRLIDIYTPDSLKHYISSLKTLRKFLTFLKNNANKTFVFDIKNRIDALKYKAVNAGGKWIFLDGKPDPEQLIKVRKELPSCSNDLTIGEIIHIFSLCDLNKAESDIVLPFDYKAEDYVCANTKNWHYDENAPKTTVRISINTCRPFYRLNDEIVWKDEATKVYGKFMSLDNMFGSYISLNSMYPSKNDFLIYISERYVKKGIPTLPVCIIQFADEIFEDHQHVMGMLEPGEFKRRWNASVEIKKRIQIE